MEKSGMEQELAERLKLIESMMAEGRQVTESWGWTFVLWGVAYFAAIGWSALGRPQLAWSVCMIAASLLTGGLTARRRKRPAATTMGRAVGAIWVAAGLSLFVANVPLGMTGRLDQHAIVTVIGAMLGGANAASGMLLRWRMQLAAALVWWAMAASACFVPDHVLGWIFLAALFFCQIVFGVYAMIRDRRRRRQAAHHG